MSVSRRTILKGAGVLGAATALPKVAHAQTAKLGAYDSRLPESRAFAVAAKRRGVTMIDIAKGDKAIWHIARQDLASPGPIIGMTGWSDWVVLRGLLEEQGKRLRSESRIAHQGTRMATPFEWAMS
jgi:hypothetical protein